MAAADSGPTVGVVIRTLNESEHIARCIQTLRQQHGGFELDVVVVDSGSTDGTVELGRANGARIVELSPDEFDYSKALNLGIESVRGDLVVSLSAHAIPVDDRWLETMLAPFADPAVAGVSSGQIPWPGARWQEVKRIRLQFDSVRRVYSRDTGDAILFSNAASAIRRSVWLEEPFTLPAVEDLDWGRRVVAAGLFVVYEPAAAVYHSHDEGPRAQARRMIDINRVRDGSAGGRPFARTLREAASFFRRDATAILALDEPIRRRLSYLAELATTVYFYVVDFSKAGTTAERRRQDVQSPG